MTTWPKNLLGCSKMLRADPFRSGMEKSGVTFSLASVRETHLVGLRESPRSFAALSMGCRI